MKQKTMLWATLILIFLFLANVPFAFAEFTGFPWQAASCDIGATYSELGKNYVKVRLHVDRVSSENWYQLLYKEYDIDRNFIKFGTSNKQRIPEFHFQVSSLNHYDFCIVVLNNYDELVANSGIEGVVPSQFIDKPKEVVSQPSAKVSSVSEVMASNLEATLDIDHQSFPFINLLSEVKQDGVPFDGDPDNLPLLDKSNFSVTEDGRIQSIRDLVPPQAQGSSKIADIVFVHDDSGSLDDEAAQVKANIQSFLNDLASGNIDYRIGLVPYGGGGKFSSAGGTILHNGILHTEASSLISDIDNMRFDGRNEQAFCAMQLAVQNIAWRPSTQKVIILITDENNDSGCINESELITLLQNANATVYALTRGHAEFDRIAAATGGKVFNITSDFTPILAEIGVAIAAKYIIQYETDNTTLDGQARTVELTVTVDDGQGGTLQETVTKDYTPSPPIEITLTSETDNLSQNGQREQSPLTIVAKITQGQTTFAGQATLFYRNVSSSYTSLSMNSLGNDLYSATVPASDVIDPYVHYYISATDGTVTSTMPSVDPADNPVVISILPNIAPIITHIPVTSIQEGQDISVSAKVEDATNEVAKVVLYYRKIGEAIYNSITETPNKTVVEYSGVVPGALVTGNGIEYYIYAEDNFGVSSSYGTPDNPIQVFVTSQNVVSGEKDIGNLTVYADSIEQDATDSNLWTASGHVMIGTKVGSKKLLSIGTSLLMHYDTNKVNALSAGNLIALDIKRNSLQDPENIPVYYGDFEVDCSANPPILTMSGGESKLRLIGNLPFLFPYAQNTITIKDDEVILHDVTAHITQGLNILLTIGDITLSQTGGSSGEIKLSGGDLLKKYPIKGSSWSIANLEFVIDLIKKSFTGSGEFEINSLIGGQKGGIGATFGFLYDPFAIETIGGKLAFPPAWQQALTIPTTPPSALGVRIDSGAFLVNKISTGLSGLQLTGSCGAKLVDATQIAELIEQITGYKPISGELALLIDLSGKVELSGAVKLLEHLELASGKIGIGNPAYVVGNLNIIDTLIGRVYLSIGVPSGYLELIGQNSLTLQIPTAAPWIGGYKLVNQAVDATLRFNSDGIDMADFRTSYKLWFIELGIRLDISDPSSPDLFITGWDKTIQVFSIAEKHKGAFEIASLKNINIDKDYDQVVVKITSDSDAALFNITFPDGTTYTPADATPTVPPDDPSITTIFFLKNAAANESYYAINKPAKGVYQLEVTNDADIGNYTVEVLGPNAKPNISIDSQTADQIWDGSSPIDISWTASDPDDNADINLYYDSDNTGNNGFLIATELKEDDAVNSYQWNVGTDVQSGSYYIYARIDDGENAPVFAYSAGKIMITNPNAPAVPNNITVTPKDGSLKVEWDVNTEQDLMGYRVYLSDSPGSGSFKYDFGAGLDTSYEIQGLVNGQKYEVAVSAVNSDGLESDLSAPQEAAPNGTGLGGSPDLTVDADNSSITSNSGKLEDVLTIQVRVQNVGVHDSYSARVSCYYGKMAESNLIDSKLIGQISAGDHLDVSFQLDIATLSDKIDGKNIFAKIDDVVLPELESGNNFGVIKNNLPFDHTINLGLGWNLISFPPSPEDCSISTILFPIDGKYSSVWSFSDGWNVYDPANPGLSDLTCLKSGLGYWVNMNKSETIAITGTIPSKLIALKNGWNLVGFNSLATLSIADALASIQGKYVAVWAYIEGVWKLHDPSNPGFSDLTTMEPGYGYWIATTGACTWTLP